MKTFKRIYIEITNCCNLSCSFCPVTKRPQRFMSLEEFETVLKKIKGHGSFVYLHIKGEPTIHPNFSEILDLCELYGLKVNLTTNGSVPKVIIKAIESCKALRQVSFSLQSQESNENSETYEAYMKTIAQLVKQGSLDSDVIFELRLWNYDERAGVLAKNKNSVALEILTKELSVDRDVFDRIPKGKGLKLLPQVYLSKNVEFQWPDMKLDEISNHGTCYGLRQQVGILVDGQVVPCCLDSEGDVNLGNVFESDFESIVTSNKSTDMVTGFEEGRIVEDLCKRCGYRSRFD